jgi:hypothetical protein
MTILRSVEDWRSKKSASARKLVTGARAETAAETWG